MSNTVISVENLSKTYRLGQIGTGTFANDLKLWWARTRGAPNPLLKIGEADHGNRDGEDVWALKDISFTVERGEVLGIIGRNGAGKSTLLKILSRITAPTSGRIRVRGRVASLLEVGTGFHPEMTGRENIYLNGAILGMSRAEIARKFDEIVDFSEVEKFIDTPVKRYSSGMYVRLAFAVAAHLEPEILVVDEVLAVGDAAFQKKCLGKMGDVAKQGRTVLFVSHNMGAVSRIAEKSLWLNSGRIIACGETEKIINSYLESSRELGSDRSKLNDPGFPIHLNHAEVNTNDQTTDEIPFGVPFSVRINFSVLAHVADASFLIALIAPDGARLATMNSSDADLRITLNEGAQMDLTWDCTQNVLIPGEYHLVFEVHDRMRTPVAQYESLIKLNILSVGAPERLVRSVKRAGYVTLSNSWNFREI